MADNGVPPDSANLAQIKRDLVPGAELTTLDPKEWNVEGRMGVISRVKRLGFTKALRPDEEPLGN